MWVRSEYAGELAVLSTWAAALLPWNVTVSSVTVDGIGAADVLFVRFPLFQVRYVFGTLPLRGTQIGLPVPAAPLPGGLLDTSGAVVSALALQRGTGLAAAYRWWAAGAAAYAVALAVSVAYYRAEARVEAGPVDPVRLLGGLLGASALLFGVATAGLLSGFPGTPIPLGIPVVATLAAALLTVDRR